MDSQRALVRARRALAFVDERTEVVSAESDGDYDATTAMARPPSTTVAHFSAPMQLLKRSTSLVTIAHAGASSNPFDKLPNELVLKIVKLLSSRSLAKMMQTCSRFHAIGNDERLWHHQDLADSTVSMDGLFSLFDRGLQVLRLSRAYILLEFGHFDPHATFNMRYLDLSYVIFDEHDTLRLYALLRQCGQLLALSLEGVRIDKNTLFAMSKCTQLVYLNMSMVNVVDADADADDVISVGMEFALAISRMENLQELNVSWMHCGAQLASVMKYVCHVLPPGLRRLCLAGGRRIAVDDTCMAAVYSHCGASLTELDISECNLVTNVGMQFILRMMPTLRVLSASRAMGIETDEFIRCDSLLELNIFGRMTDAGYAFLRERLPHTRVNANMFTTVARPTTGDANTTIWLQKTRDDESE